MLAKNIIQITNGCPDISMLPWISKKYLYEERNVTNQMQQEDRPGDEDFKDNFIGEDRNSLSVAPRIVKYKQTILRRQNLL